MALRKDIKYPKVTRISYKSNKFSGVDEMNDEHMLNDNIGKDCVNFSYKTGALTQSLGVNLAELPLYNEEYIVNLLPSFNGKTIQQLFHYKRYNITLDRPNDELIVLCDNILYKIPLYGLDYQTVEIYRGFYEKATACNYNYNGEDVLLISSIVNGLFIYNGTTMVKVNNSPHIKSLIVHNERVFALVYNHPYSVWFSDDFNPMNWNISLNEAGFINMPDALGEVKKIVSLQDAIYIFRDYGIMRLIALGDQKDFILNSFYTSNNIILDKTIATDNNHIVFVTDKNIMILDAVGIKSICQKIGKTLSKLNYKFAEAIINSDRFIFAARSRVIDYNTMNNAENDYNDTLLSIDLNDNNIEKVYSLDVKCLLSLNTRHFNKVLLGLRGTYKGFLLNLDNSGKIMNAPLIKKWTSPLFDLKLRGVLKILKQFAVFSKNDIKIRFMLDGNEVFYNIKGSKRTVININKSFYEFSYEITAETDEAYVLPIEFVFNVTGD